MYGTCLNWVIKHCIFNLSEKILPVITSRLFRLSIHRWYKSIWSSPDSYKGNITPPHGTALIPGTRFVWKFSSRCESELCGGSAGLPQPLVLGCSTEGCHRGIKEIHFLSCKLQALLLASHVRRSTLGCFHAARCNSFMATGERRRALRI